MQVKRHSCVILSRWSFYEEAHHGREQGQEQDLQDQDQAEGAADDQRTGQVTRGKIDQIKSKTQSALKVM